MKKHVSLIVSLLLFTTTFAQQKLNESKTLLWKVTGNGLVKPSYIYGTIHMICKDDAVLSDNMVQAVENADAVYFEVDMDNMMEMITVMGKMKMKGDTTLQNLMSAEEYTLVKKYFKESNSLLPFSMLEKLKPILSTSLIEKNTIVCDNVTSMEETIMRHAKKYGKPIKGLESMASQAEVLDKIPYKEQAQQLVQYVKQGGSDSISTESTKVMMQAYKDQDLDLLEQIMFQGEVGIEAYAEPLLYNRNRNWIVKLKELMPAKSLVVAVGAGHLPGKNGVLQLLRNAGFTVTPVENNAGNLKTI